jgi:hypothetical protein
MKYGVWSIGGMTLTGESEVLGQQHIPVSVFSPQMPHWLGWYRTRFSAVEGPE